MFSKGASINQKVIDTIKFGALQNRFRYPNCEYVAFRLSDGKKWRKMDKDLCTNLTEVAEADKLYRWQRVLRVIF